MLDFSRIDPNEPLPDTSETMYVSPLALIKMLRHARQGIPLEVMGLMLGEFIDEYTIVLNDVYAMPQTGTEATVEAVDPVYQTQMNEALELVNKNENLIGWYHSHPGFGCWLSGVDMSTQESFEKLQKRAIALVLDPVQSVKGKVVLDAFRLVSNHHIISGVEPRQVSSNIGFLRRDTMVALLHGLGRNYYSLRVKYRRTVLEEKMIMRIKRNPWNKTLEIPKYDEENKDESEIKKYLNDWDVNKDLSDDELKIKSVGKINYRQRLLDRCENTYNQNIIRELLLSIHKSIFAACPE